MFKFKKALAAVMAAIMLTGCMAGCGGDKNNSSKSNSADKTAASGDKVVVGVCAYKYDDAYISTVRKALQDLAKDSNGKMELLMNDGKGDQATQNDQIDMLLQKKVNCLLVNMVDASAAQAVVDKCKKADIPVVFFNREPESSIVKSYDKAMFIGTNAKEAGVLQGKILIDAWNANKAKYDTNKNGVMDYVMLQGEPGNPEAIARTEWSVKTIEDAGIKTHKVAEQICNWDTQLAQQAVEAWLSKDKNSLEVVIANNDGMAQGAVAALQAQGKNLNESNAIPVVGVDAIDAAKDLISKNQMIGTVLQDGPAMAKALYVAAGNSSKVKKADDFIANTDYKMDDTGVAVRIPYQKYVNDK